MLRLHVGDAAAYIREELERQAGIIETDHSGGFRRAQVTDSRPAVIFLDCYDNKGRVPKELTEPGFLADCLQVGGPSWIQYEQYQIDERV